MDIAIAGAHGQIARLLTRALTARGDAVVGLVRNPDHHDDVRADGGRPVTCDLEGASVDDVAEAIRGCQAVVFAAGAGPGSGAARKDTMDRDGAVLLAGAAQAAGATRYVMVSAMGTDDPPDDDSVFSAYLRAKAAADQAVMGTGLAWTIVRPGRLTDDDPTGMVALARHVPAGEVPRADVAEVLAEVLHDDRTAELVLELVGGGTPIREALGAAVAAADR